jgi:plasmid stabilization system protein ParE
MVIYSDSVRQDLEDIFYGLVTWKKHPLTWEHAKQYVRDIRQEADTICKKSHHFKAALNLHKKFGTMVHVYQRNRHTQWYIIYWWDTVNRVAYVTKIINNYLSA